jgi:hypothetical protein
MKGETERRAEMMPAIFVSLVAAVLLHSPLMFVFAILIAAFWLFAGIVVTFGKWFADLL